MGRTVSSPLAGCQGVAVTDLPTSGATDQSLLRRINIVSTLQALRGRPSQTLREVAQVTGVSWRTTNELVDELVQQGWAEEVPPDQNGRKMGRPARRFRFRSDAGYVLGIDVGVHKVLALLADLDGTVVGAERIAVGGDSSPKSRLAAVRSAATRSLAAAGIDRSQLRAVTVGTVGVIDDSGKVQISVAPGWTGLDITGALRRSFPCPVLVENDCNLGAAAELWLGFAQDSRNTVYVLAGRRTGAGLVIGGRLHRGNHGAAGEIGALPALGWANAQRHFSDYEQLPAGVSSDDAAGHVFAAAGAGDLRAREAVDGFARDLATGIAAMVLTVDPELVVVGGGYAPAGDVLLDPLRSHLEELCLCVPRVEASELGDRSVALGAVRLALDHVEQQLFSHDALPRPAAAKTP